MKQLVHDLPAYRQFVPEANAELDRIADSLLKKNKSLIDASSAAVKPVTHSIKIEVEP